MINNKQGLSDIILTLIMILLVLVAVGVVWAVASGVINRGAGKVDLGTRCLDVDIRATALRENSPGNYSLILVRSAGGEKVAGVKVVLFGNLNNTGVINGAGLDPLETRTVIIDSTASGGLTNATKVEITPYFKDDSGKEQLCSTTTKFSF